MALVAGASSASAQTPSRYRDFVLGSNVSAVALQLGVATTEAKLVHERPALIQDLQWRTPYFMSGSNETQKDPVQEMTFSFYNDQLFRISIGYDRQRTVGMTDADMVAALTATYGPAAKPRPRTGPMFASRLDADSGTPIAQWGDAESSVILFRSSIGTGFEVTVASSRLEALARAADTQAMRLEEREAPQRELARQKQDAETERASQEKARATNKAAFRP
jgi:hypothetical protein